MATLSFLSSGNQHDLDTVQPHPRMNATLHLVKGQILPRSSQPPAPAVNSADFGRSSKGFLARGVSVMAQRFMDPEHIPEAVGSIPGLTPRGKDPAWPGGVEWAPDTAWIPCCSGCAGGRQLGLRSTLQPGNLHMLRGQPSKDRRQRTKDTHTNHFSLLND